MPVPFQRDTVRPFAEIQPAIDELETHLQAALRLPPAGRIRLLSQLGTLYRSSPAPALAIAHFEEAIRLSRQHNLRKDEAVNTLRLAVAYQYADRIDEATAAFKAALVLCAQRQTHLDFAYQHWGKFLVEQGEAALAVPFFEQALMQRLGGGSAELIDSTRAALEAARSLAHQGGTSALPFAIDE